MESQAEEVQNGYDITMEWTSERTELAKLIREFDGSAGDLYGHAVNAFSRHPLARAPIMVGSHCIRELFSLLAELSPGDACHGSRDQGAPLTSVIPVSRS
ncbi:MAG: hypothetical protein ACLP81_03770, partial [Acidimicrobiales bacterium]